MAISDFIAICAILVSLLSVYFSFRANKNSLTLQKEQTEMQKRITQIEESRERYRITQSQKANLRAELQKKESTTAYLDKYHIRVRDHGCDYRLLIINDGPGTARNVKATLDGKPLSEHPAVLSFKEEDSLTIGPHSKITYVMSITLDMVKDPGKLPSFEFKATWEDDSGEPGKCKMTLTIG